MQIKDYWAVVSKRWWIFVLVAVVAATTAYVYSKMQQPLFRSTAKLYVTPARPDYGVTLFVQNLIRQYGQQLQGDRFLNGISEQLKLDLTPDTLRERIHTSGTTDNLAIMIEVDDPSPGKAQDIAKALAFAFIENHQVKMENVDKRDKVDVEMYDDPTPSYLYSPKTKVNVMAGGVLGLLIGGLIAFFLEYLDDTIKSSEDVERFVELPVIGSIPTITHKEMALEQVRRSNARE